MPWPHEIITRQQTSKSKVLGSRILRRNSTSSERILWNELRQSKLGVHFRRQQVIGGYVVDFYCHRVGLVIELDDPIHASQRAQDAQRDEHLTNLGLRVVRFTNKQVEKDLSAVLKTISTFISAAGAL